MVECLTCYRLALPCLGGLPYMALLTRFSARSRSYRSLDMLEVGLIVFVISEDIREFNIFLSFKLKNAFK